MRLIDADALKKAFKKSPFVNEVYLYYARQLINLAPTVEERPHGEWKYEPKLRLVDETDDGAIYETEMKCFCSACGADFGFRKVDDAFCKYCGADMRPRVLDEALDGSGKDGNVKEGE